MEDACRDTLPHKKLIATNPTLLRELKCFVSFLSVEDIKTLEDILKKPHGKENSIHYKAELKKRIVGAFKAMLDNGVAEKSELTFLTKYFTSPIDCLNEEDKGKLLELSERFAIYEESCVVDENQDEEVRETGSEELEDEDLSGNSYIDDDTKVEDFSERGALNTRADALTQIILEKDVKGSIKIANTVKKYLPKDVVVFQNLPEENVRAYIKELERILDLVQE